MPDINVNQLAESINNKADLNLLNTSDNTDFVVESYSNGTSWYRVYKSGWVEQGGTYDNSSLAQRVDTDITFLKSFSSDNYNILSQAYRNDNRDADIFVSTFINTKTSTTAHIVAYGNGGSSTTRYITWKAEGQGA